MTGPTPLVARADGTVEAIRVSQCNARKAKAAFDEARHFWPGSASEYEAWTALAEALADHGPRHPAKPKPLSDRMSVGE